MVDLKEDGATSGKNEEPTRNLAPKENLFFDKCCFFIPLRTGSLILAYLFLIGNVVSGVLSLLSIITAVMFLIRVYEEPAIIIMLVINALSLVLDLVTLSFNVLLLIGLHKERRNYVKIFLIFQLVNIIINVLKHIAVISIGYLRGIFIAMVVVTDVLNIYYLFVMRCQYVKMVEAGNKLPRQVYHDGRVVITP